MCVIKAKTRGRQFLLLFFTQKVRKPSLFTRGLPMPFGCMTTPSASNVTSSQKACSPLTWRHLLAIPSSLLPPPGARIPLQVLAPWGSSELSPYSAFVSVTNSRGCNCFRCLCGETGNRWRGSRGSQIHSICRLLYQAKAIISDIPFEGKKDISI